MIISTTLISKNAVNCFVLLINLVPILLFQDVQQQYMNAQQDYVDFLYLFNVVQSLMNMALIALSIWLLYENNKETWLDRIPEKIKKIFSKKKE